MVTMPMIWPRGRVTPEKHAEEFEKYLARLSATLEAFDAKYCRGSAGEVIMRLKALPSAFAAFRELRA